MEETTGSKSWDCHGIESKEGLKLQAGGVRTYRCGRWLTEQQDNLGIYLETFLLNILHSTFFGAALEVGFAESISNVVALPDDDPRGLEHFVQLLCLGNRIDCPNSTVWCCLRDQVRTWILADKLGYPILQDTVMVNLIEDLHGGLINEVNLKMMYDESAPGSKLRQLAVDQILYDAKCSQLEDREQPYVDLADIMEEFAKDISNACLRMVSSDFKYPAMQRERYLRDPTFEIDAS